MHLPPRTDANLKTFTWGILVVSAVISAFLLWRGREEAALIPAFFFLWALPALAFRPLILPLFVVFSYFGAGLGWVNTHLVLGLTFYLVLTPMGVVMRLFGRDPLRKAPDRKVSTYWRDADPPPPVEQYRRQY